MKISKPVYTFLTLLVIQTGDVGAAEILGGSGIGFDDAPIPWVSTVMFDKQDVKAGAPAFIVQSGDNVTPPAQKHTNAQIWVPNIKATSWCDSYANPLVRNNQDFNACYGNAWESNWYVLDLNALQKVGLKGVWVAVTARRVDAGPMAGSGSGLIPAITVWQGAQEEGSNLQWFPQTFQLNPVFWASQLTPFTGGLTRSSGWDTAYDTVKQEVAEVTGWVKLRPGGHNFLTVAVGGDLHKKIVGTTTNAVLKYALALRVSRTKPKATKDTWPAAAPQATQASTVGAGSYQAGLINLTVTNSLTETIQVGTSAVGPWSDVNPSASYSVKGNIRNASINYLTLFIKSSHGDERLLLTNGTLGYPSASMQIPRYGQWIAGLFDLGYTAAVTAEGRSYTITRYSDEEDESNLGIKSFGLTLRSSPSNSPVVR